MKVRISISDDKKNPSVSKYFLFLNVFYTHSQLHYALTHPLFNYMFQMLSFLHWQGYISERTRYFCYFSFNSSPFLPTF